MKYCIHYESGVFKYKKIWQRIIKACILLITDYINIIQLCVCQMDIQKNESATKRFFFYYLKIYLYIIIMMIEFIISL